MRRVLYGVASYLVLFAIGGLLTFAVFGSPAALAGNSEGVIALRIPCFRQTCTQCYPDCLVSQAACAKPSCGCKIEMPGRGICEVLP